MTQSIEYIIYGIPPTEKFLENYTDALTLVTAAMSVLIACIALIATYRQSRKIDIHNRLMVTPSLNDDTHVDIENNTYEYKISNKGIGPAIITSATIYIDGKEFLTEDALVDAIEMILVDTNLEYEHQSIALGAYISPNETIEVMTVKTDKINTPMVVRVKTRQRAPIVLNYKSIYGDTYTFDSETGI